MASMMNIPILGLIENYSYITCPHCGEKISVFGKSNAEEVAKEFNIKLLDRLPIDPEMATLCDQGQIEKVKETRLENVLDVLESLEVPA